MREILKYARVNVRVADKETQRKLFEGHNLFVDSGRQFIAQTLMNTITGFTIDASKFVCDLGNSAATVQVTDLDLGSYMTISIAVNSPTYPKAIPSVATGIHFNFSYNNSTGGDITIRELGLFYRPSSDNFPLRGSVPATMTGVMLARLKTTYSSIVVGNGRTVNIDWKIIF